MTDHTDAHEDEYDALARELHKSIAEGQTEAETAKALRFLGGEPVSNEDADYLREIMRTDEWDDGITLLDEALRTERRMVVDEIRERAMKLPCYRPGCDCKDGPIARHGFRSILDEIGSAR